MRAHFKCFYHWNAINLNFIHTTGERRVGHYRYRGFVCVRVTHPRTLYAEVLYPYTLPVRSSVLLDKHGHPLNGGPLLRRSVTWAQCTITAVVLRVALPFWVEVYGILLSGFRVSMTSLDRTASEFQSSAPSSFPHSPVVFELMVIFLSFSLILSHHFVAMPINTHLLYRAVVTQGIILLCKLLFAVLSFASPVL